MEHKLIFHLELATGEEVQQEFNVPADKVQIAINQLLATFMQLGYVKQEEGILTCQRVIKAKVAIPQITIAGPNEMPKGGGLIQP